MLSSVEVWAPVTALHVCQDYLFVGISNKLEIYKILESSLSLPIHTQWENCWKIHGFCSKLHDELIRFAAYGNRFLSLNVLDIEKNAMNHSRNVYIGDWIQTADFFDPKCLAIITSHNKLLLLNCDTGEIFREVTGPTKGILYSSVIMEMKPPQHITIVCGTVFSELMIWEHQEGCEPPKPFSIDGKHAHSGAIFALEYSKESKILYSASDDRSIGIWQSTQSKSFLLCSKVLAHEGRIWKLLAVGQNLISCGENDLCIWNAKGQLSSRKKSEKSCIWSLAGSESKSVFFAGANNGSILIVPIEGNLSQPISKPSALRVTRKPRYFIFHPSIPDHVVVIDEQSFVDVFAFDGRSLVKKREEKLKLKPDSEWVVTHDSKRLYVLGGRRIYSIPVNLDQSFEFDIEEKILPHEEEFDSCLFVGGYLITMVRQPSRFRVKMVVLIVDEKLLSETNIESEKKFPIFVTSEKMGSSVRAPLTCGLAMSGQFILGCADGSLFQYKYGEKEKIDFMKAHSFSVNCLEAKPCSQFFYSCGRDWNVNEYNLAGDTGRLRILRKISFSFRYDWIERIFFDTNDRLNVIGHSPNKLSFWREKDLSALWELSGKVDGGLWNFSSDQNKVQLVFFRRGALFSFSKSLNPLVYHSARIRPKFHSSKVNCVALLCIRGSKAYIASGGEDNMIVIEEFDAGAKELTPRHILHGHISSIRSLASYEDVEKVYLVSGGGRSQLLVWTIQVEESGDILFREVAKHLNWTDEVCSRTHWKDFCIQKETQARYLACGITRQNECLSIAMCCSDGFLRLFIFNIKSKDLSLVAEKQVSDFCPLSILRLDDLIAVGSNDGTVSFWRPQTIDASILQASEAKRPPEATPSKDQVSIEKIHEEKIHQSGVNCLKSVQLNSGTYLVFSGGDDGTLHGSIINLNSGKFNLYRDKSIIKAHDSQISSVNFVDHNTLVTVSVNEKISLWKMDNSLDELSDSETELQVEEKFSLISSVADAASSVMLNFTNLSEAYLLIAGEGFQIIKINY